MNFAEIQEQGFIPPYIRERITDDLHDVCGFRTDYQFITKSKMRTIQKKSKGKEQITIVRDNGKNRCNPVTIRLTAIFYSYQLSKTGF